jgi:hypothetical protein
VPSLVIVVVRCKEGNFAVRWLHEAARCHCVEIVRWVVVTWRGCHVIVVSCRNGSVWCMVVMR